MAVIQWVGGTSSDAAVSDNYNPDTAFPVAGDTLIFNTGSQNFGGYPAKLLEIAISDLVITSDYTGYLGGAAVSDGAAHTAHAASTTSDINIDSSDVTSDYTVNKIVYNATDETWHRVTAVNYNPVGASDTVINVLPGAVTAFDGLSVQCWGGPACFAPSRFALYGHVGTTGDYLILGTTSDAGADLRCPKLVVKGADRTAALYLDGDITTCTILRGDVTVESTCKGMDNLYVGYVDSRDNDVDLTVEAGAALTTVDVMGGDTANANAVTTLLVGGGTWAHTAGNITTLDMTGGEFEWNDPGGVIAALTVFSGTFDATDDPSAKTLTAVTMYGGTIDLRNQAANIVVTTGVQRFAGELLTDAGSTVDISYE